jgi:hypothetical protein
MSTLRQVFKDRRDIFERNLNISAKYTQLFQRYDCFTNINQNFVKHHGKANDKRKNYHERERPRTFQSLWNTLNDTNYHKISKTIKFMISNDNISTVVNDIISNAIIHSIYRKYFILLLKDISHIGYSDTVTKEIIHFFNDFIDNQKYIFQKKLVDDEYSYFCDEQKHKTKVLNTIMFLVDVKECFKLDDMNFDSYIKHTIEHVTSPTCDAFHLNMYLTILHILSDKFVIIPDKLQDVNIHCMKNKFLKEKLMNKLMSKLVH